MALRHFAIENEPGEGERYKSCMKKYLLGKRFLKFINYVYCHMEKWPNIEHLGDCLATVCKHFGTNETLYLKSLVQELVALLILDLGKQKQIIYEEWL